MISSNDGSIIFAKGVDAMKKKLTMIRCKELTLSEGFALHLESCRLRNLREGTIRHYKDSYRQFMKFFPADMPISEMNEKKYNEHILCLKSRLESAETVHAYGRDLAYCAAFLDE